MKARRTATPRTRKHPALTHFSLEERVYRVRARLTLLAAAFEAKALIGVDIDAAVGGVDRTLRECLTDLDAIDRLPGSVLTTPTKGGAR